jgi:nitrate/nitrite transporter NarK
MSKTALLDLIRVLGRFVPIVSRGLALAFLIAAALTAFLDIGDYAGMRDRYLVAGLLLAFAGVSFAIGLAVRPFLRWLLRRT